MTTTLARRFILAPLIAAALSIPAVAHAQIRDLVFQHGLNSTGATWTTEANEIWRVYKVYTFTPTVNWAQSFGSQGAALAQAVAGTDSDAILIGHSNGGLVGRAANMPSPYPGRPWGGLITVGTPHGGAQLAASVGNGNVGAWLSDVVYDASDAVSYYDDFVLTGSLAPVATAVSGLSTLAARVTELLAALGAWLWSGNPVSAEMSPGSSMLSSVLNVSGNLSREASAIPVRVGITSTVSSNTGLPWKAMFSDWQSKHNTKVAIQGAFYAAAAAAAGYNNEEDPNRGDINSHAYLWWTAGDDLAYFDVTYCFLMGAVQGGVCGASDAIVPLAAQVYPGATQSIAITPGPSHIQETTSGEVDAELKNLFDNVFGIDRRPTTHWASVYGPTTMQPNNTCHWYAQTNVQDAYFSWRVNGNEVGTSQDLYYSATTSFTLELQVWNDNGHGNGASSAISVSGENDECFEMPPSALRQAPPTGIRRVPIRVPPRAK